MRRIRLNLPALRARNLPRLLRPGLSAEQLLNSSESLTLTRRRMLGLAGAAAMTLPLQAAADARPFQFVAGRKRVVFRVQGRDQWVIDTRRFSGNPHLTTSRGKDFIGVELKDARYPGTDIPADLVCELIRGVVGWQMHLRIAYGGFESRTPFTSWLEGGVPARSTVLIDGRVCSLGSSARLAACGSAQAEFFPNWTLHLAGRGVAKLSGVGGGASSDSLVIALLSPGEASLLRRPPAQRTLLAMNRGDRAWRFGPEFARDASWDLVASDAPFDVIHIETGEGSSGEPGRALLAESRRDEPAFSFQPGERFAASDGARFHLPLRNIRYALSFDGDRDESALVADYDSAPTWLHAGGCSFEIGGSAEAEPFELTMSSGNPARVRCAPPLRRIAAPLPDAIAQPGAVQEGTRLAFAFGPEGAQVRAVKPAQTVRAVTQFPLPVLEGPSFSVEVTRPDDLLSLKFDFYNLHLTAGGANPSLVRGTPGQPAYMVVGFWPQHIVEAAFNEPDLPAPLPGLAEPPVPSRLAGPSRLAFLVPETMPAIPYSLDTLLDWSKFEQSVTPLATPPPLPTQSLTRGGVSTHGVGEPNVNAVQKTAEYYRTVQPVTVQTSTARAQKPPKGKQVMTPVAPLGTAAALVDLFRVKQPELYQTAIEAPYRLILSPSYFAGWTHALRAVQHGGRTELWHTRLGVRAQEGQIDEHNDYYRTVRAVWAQDFESVCPESVNDNPPFPPREFLTSPSTLDRYQLVRLSADQFLTNGDESTYVPRPIQVNRLMLSTLGAWMNVHGGWAPVDQGIHDKACANSAFSLVDWDHITAMGRDQYVRVITEGYLFPFGHRAVQIKITERKFNRTPRGNQMAAYLRQRTFVVVKDHEKSYPASGQQHPKGPNIPFQTVRITTLSTPALDTPIPPLLNEDAGSSNPRAYYPRVTNADFQFHLQGVDWEGRTSEFTAPLIYVDATIARIPIFATELITLYGSGTANQERRTRPLSGQKVAYARNTQPGDTAFETNTLTFMAEAWDNNQPPARPQPYFYPALEKAEVRIAAVEQLTGSAATTGIGYHETYLDGGLESSANKGQVFAKLLDPVPLQFGGAGAGADKVGGLLTPSMTLSGLSRNLGVVAGNLANMAAGSFDPTDIFKDALGATLLGDISLQDVIAKVADFSGALGKVPKFVTTTTSDTVATTFTWQPEIANVPASDPYFVVTGDKSSALTLSATLTKHLDNKPPSYVVNGSLQQFQILLVPGVMDLLAVGFKSVSFSSVNGKKPDFSVDLSDLTFKGPLSFINALKDLIHLDGFKDPPSLDVTSEGIEMGYSLTLPPVGVGVFTLSNVSLGAQLNVYFSNKPISFEFDFCTEDQPFLLTVSLFGGGGFFGLAVSPHGITRMSGGFDFGGSFALNLGVASGGVYVLAGVSYTYDKTSGSSLTGSLRCGGSLEVLCIITVSVEFDMSLTYYEDGNRLHGRATLTVEVKVMFFSKSVDLTVERDFAGGGGAQATLLEGGEPLPLGPTMVGFADQMAAADWQTYCEAFA